MKVDKDTLLKHRFWILVGLSLPFTLLAILVRSTSVAGSIDEARKKLKGLSESAVKTTTIHTPEELAVKKTEADLLYGHESKAWKSAYDDQEVIFRWSRAMEAKYNFADG